LPKLRFFLHFGGFEAGSWAKLASVWWKTHLPHDSQPFLPLESRLRHFGPGMRRNQNFEFLDEKVTYGFTLFNF